MRSLLVPALCILCTSAAAAADAVPVRELVHPFPPAGPVEVSGASISNRVLRTLQHYAAPAFTDILAMHVAHSLQGAEPSNVVVTRKARRSGNEAAEYVARAGAHGRTLLLSIGDPDLRDGLRLVADVAKMPYVLIAAADSPGFEFLLHDAKTGARKIYIATGGARTAGRRALELLRMKAGVEAVVYNGGRDALQAVVTAQVRAALVPLPAVLPYLGGGRLKPLAITDDARHPSIPGVPTSAEAGLAGVDAVSWFALHAPSATPAALIEKIDASVSRVAAAADAREVFAGLGLTLHYREVDRARSVCIDDVRIKTAGRHLRAACPPA
jgi:tripartite-type tricarboxylate transporter receptor subunit TctC